MKIRPFAAVRPAPEFAAQVAAVPYDVVDTAEARALAAGNPKSFLHVSRPEIDMPDGTDCSSPEAYAQARKALDALRADGTLLQEGEPTFYAYRQIMAGRAQTGIVAVFDTEDYLAGVLKQHEKTRQDKEDDRTNHIRILGAQTGPAFLTYRDGNPYGKAIAEIVAAACRETPLYDFTADDGIQHTVWKIVAGSEGESKWFMAVIFPASELKILPYNRLVHDLNGLTAEQVLAKANEVFTGGSRHCRMYLDGKWHELSWEIPAGADPVSALDVSFLQDRFLAPVLGIADPRTDARISFMGGIRGEGALAAKVDEGTVAVAFSMEGVSVEEMMSIADAGQVMPPKSTWFEPKLRSGLFVHALA